MKTLEDMTKPELLELATKYDVAGRAAMNKAELLAAVSAVHVPDPEAPAAPPEEPTSEGATEPAPPAADAADPEPAPPTTPEGHAPPEAPKAGDNEAKADELEDDEEIPAPPEPEGQDPAADLPLEDREVLAIKNAPTEKLRAALDDPDFPPHLLRAIRDELRERSKAQQAQRAQKALQGKQSDQQYTVVAARRYVTKDGFITNLAPGCILSRLTHDLEHVKSQGIELVPCGGVEVAYDEMGNLKTRVV